MGEENYIEPNFMCELGLNISLGSNVYINHDMVILDCNEVTTGDHISDRVLPGVTIGENSIIGAGSVVTKDIPANVIAAGNPCRVIRGIQKKG